MRRSIITQNKSPPHIANLRSEMPIDLTDPIPIGINHKQYKITGQKPRQKTRAKKRKKKRFIHPFNLRIEMDEKNDVEGNYESLIVKTIITSHEFSFRQTIITSHKTQSRQTTITQNSTSPICPSTDPHHAQYNASRKQAPYFLLAAPKRSL